MIVAPSILSADFNNLYSEVKSCEDAQAQFLHCDIMDGHFVPNISFGAVVIKNLKNVTNMVFDVHLMITDPMKYVSDFIKVGADYITFHFETTRDLTHDTIKKIKSMGTKVGISIKPSTDVKELKPYLNDLDLILIMSVEPGFGGQEFMPSALDKISYLANEKKNHNYKYLIEVDGGINYDTASLCKKAGCEIVVAGTYIFKAIGDKRQDIIKELRQL